MGGWNTDLLLEKAQELVFEYGPNIVGALLTLLVGWLIAKAVKRGMQRLVQRTEFDATLEAFAVNLVYRGTMLLVAILVLGFFGVETTSFIAVLGAGSFGFVLAIGDTISNFAAGVMLLVLRPFKVGDFIEVAGKEGSVCEIGIFSTELDTGANIRIIVPNSAIYGSVISNYSHNPTRRNDMLIGISYDDDIGKAIEIVKGVLSEDERVLTDPAPLVAVKELGDSSVNLVVRPWCKREHSWALRLDLNRRIKERLEAGGCSLPYPQQDVHLIRRESAA